MDNQGGKQRARSSHSDGAQGRTTVPSTCGGRNHTQEDGERSSCLHARLTVRVKEGLELRLETAVETTHKHQEAGAAAQPAGSPSEPPPPPPSTRLSGANLALSSVGGSGARAPEWARLQGEKKKKGKESYGATAVIDGYN